MIKDDDDDADDDEHDGREKRKNNEYHQINHYYAIPIGNQGKYKSEKRSCKQTYVVKK